MGFNHIEFALLILAALANLGLVFLVIRFGAKRQDIIFFALFGLSQTIWIVVNFFAINSDQNNILQYARWTIAAAVPHSSLFYLLTLSFLQKTKFVSAKIISITLFFMLVMVVIALSPYLFTHLENQNGQPTPVAGPGMLLFAVYFFTFVTLAIIRLIKSWKKASGIEKVQWRFLGTGLITTVILVIVFNFIFPVVFQNLKSVNYGYLYTFPFVLFTTYAIVKHHLLNVKVIATEWAVGLLSLLFLMEFLTSTTISDFILNGIVLIALVSIGIMLVKSVIKEIERRSEIEKLAQQLETANTKLKKLDEAKTEFLSITSHQLRTPLSSIKGYLSMILDGDFGKFKKEQEDALDRVYGEVERLIRLVQVFLNVSRIESGRLKIAQVEFDVSELVDNVVEQLRYVAEDKGLEINYHKTMDKIPYVGDPDKLKDVIVNLVDNAIKYTQKGKVWVEAGQNSKNIVVEVHDTGVGIEKGYAANLFEKFSRAKGIAQIDAGGTGLGLFIVKKIVEGHHGTIKAESDGPGKGTTFILTLPLDHPRDLEVKQSDSDKG